MISVIKKILDDSDSPQVIPACLFYRKGGYSVGGVSLDLILDEDHSMESSIADHVLESGSTVSDHIFNLLREGSLTALITNHSIQTSAGTADTDVKGIYQNLAEGMYDSVQLSNRAYEAWQDLKKIWEARELVTVTTSLEVYEDVAITSYSTSRDGDTGECLQIKLEFRQVKKVRLKEDKITAAVQPTDMKSDINRKSAVRGAGGQKVGKDVGKDYKDYQEYMFGDYSIGSGG